MPGPHLSHPALLISMEVTLLPKEELGAPVPEVTHHLERQVGAVLAQGPTGPMQLGQAELQGHSRLPSADQGTVPRQDTYRRVPANSPTE